MKGKHAQKKVGAMPRNPLSLKTKGGGLGGGGHMQGPGPAPPPPPPRGQCHSLPFPWTLSLHRRWCPLASHHPLPFLFLLALSFPLYFPFLSHCGLCQWSPRTFSVLVLARRGRVGGTIVYITTI